MNILKKWFIILRAYSWPASIIPMLIGSAMAYKYGNFRFIDFILTFIAGLSLHSAANLSNTYFDFKNGVDQKGADDIAIVENLISPYQAKIVFITLFIFSIILGLFIVFKNNNFLLIPLSIIGFALAWFYTANFSYKYKALGEIGIFLCFGPLLVSGTFLIQTGKISIEPLIASVPTGLLIVGILLANNIRDINSDSKSKIKTLPQIIGEKNAIIFYYSLLFISYLVAIIFIKSIYVVVLLFSLPFLFKLIKIVQKKDFFILVRKTSEFVGVFGILFIVAILLKS